MWALDATLTAEAGQALAAVLAPLSVPRPGPDGQPDQRTATMRRADAMGEAAARLLGSDTLPTHGGLRPNMTVIIDLDTLTGGARSAAHGDSGGSGHGGGGCAGGGGAGGGGWFPNGQGLSAAATERIGCDARISWVTTRTGGMGNEMSGLSDDEREMVRAALRRVSPALGGLPTEVLDLGRAQRLLTAAQRRALVLRDRGCVWPGCDRPPDWCDAHHLTFWSHGGNTDLPNLALMCARHHTFAHDGWTLTRQPEGTVTAKPPP